MNKKILRKFALAFICGTFFFSCRSAPDIPAVDPLSLLSSDAAMYIYIPVKGNQDFVTQAFAKIARTSTGDAKRISSRTETLAIATGTSNHEFEAAVLGNYPIKYAASALNEKNGWKVKNDPASQMVYYEQSASAIQMSLPSNYNVLVSYDVSPMIENYGKALDSLLAHDVGIEGQSYQNGIGDDVVKFLTGGTESEIRMIAPDPQKFLKRFLGKSVNVKVSSLSGILTPSKKENVYAFRLDLDMTDPRTTKAACALLKIALFPIPAKIQQLSASRISITDIDLSWNELLNLIYK